MVPLLTMIAVTIGGQTVPAPPDPIGIAGLRQELRSIYQAEANRLEASAEAAEVAGRADEAAAIRALIEPPVPPDGPQPYRPLPEYVPAQEPDPAAASLPAGALETQGQAVDALLDLARRAAAPGASQLALAVDALRGVLARHPDHREARRLIGHVEYDDGWATPHAAKNLEAGYVLHPTYGWVPAEWVEHLEQGRLPGILAEGRPVPWLSAKDADALRSDFFRRPWQISTEHFDIATNVPLAEAIAFGRRLEAVRDVFVSLFADVLGPENLDIDDRFRDPNRWATPSTTRHQVWYFAERAQYVGYFRRIGRDESASLGYYMPASEARRLRQEPRSYFFRNDGDPLAGLPTLFHEASHQLLFELAGPSQHDRNVGQYWIWEGLGTYFETFTPKPDGSYEIGGRIGPRMAKARRDIVEEGRFTPTADLTAMSSARFQDEQKVYSHYAEAMALVAYLMHADESAHREAFLGYVADAYRGQFRPGANSLTLAERLDIPTVQLDERFRGYLAGGAEQVARGAGRSPRLAPGGNLRLPGAE